MYSALLCLNELSSHLPFWRVARNRPRFIEERELYRQNVQLDGNKHQLKRRRVSGGGDVSGRLLRSSVDLPIEVKRAARRTKVHFVNEIKRLNAERSALALKLLKQAQSGQFVTIQCDESELNRTY